jgi:hypothetical protein
VVGLAVLGVLLTRAARRTMAVVRPPTRAAAPARALDGAVAALYRLEQTGSEAVDPSPGGRVVVAATAGRLYDALGDTATVRYQGPLVPAEDPEAVAVRAACSEGSARSARRRSGADGVTVTQGKGGSSMAPRFQLKLWLAWAFPKNWTSIDTGSFVGRDPTFDQKTQIETSLFCFDRNSGMGAFYAIVRNAHLADGTPVPDGPYRVGGDHPFGNRWTFAGPGPDLPGRGRVMLLYDALSGTSEFAVPDFRGGLIPIKRDTGWSTSLSQLVPGYWPGANLLLYDRANGTGDFYNVDNHADLHVQQSHTGWRTSWDRILGGAFSASNHTDLLFYDRAAGSAEFYRVGDGGRMALFSEHDNWRTTWQHVVVGQFLRDSPADGLLFYEQGSGYTELYSTDGRGSISQIDMSFGQEWAAAPWDLIRASRSPDTPALGLPYTSNLCAYSGPRGLLGFFYITGLSIQTVVDLEGTWAYAGVPGPRISESFASLTVDMSAYHRPTASGSVLDASTISVTFPDDATYTATLRPPGTLVWSNGSTWTRIGSP